MGNTQAAGFAEAVAEGLCSLDSALQYHLFTNHYPALPPESLEIANQAIDKANEGEWEATIDISDHGISHRVHGTEVPVHVFIEDWHLYPFVTTDDEDEEDYNGI